MSFSGDHGLEAPGVVGWNTQRLSVGDRSKDPCKEFHCNLDVWPELMSRLPDFDPS